MSRKPVYNRCGRSLPEPITLNRYYGNLWKNVGKRIDKHHYTGMGATEGKRTKRDGEFCAMDFYKRGNFLICLRQCREPNKHVLLRSLASPICLISGAFGWRCGGHFATFERKAFHRNAPTSTTCKNTIWEGSDL